MTGARHLARWAVAALPVGVLFADIAWGADRSDVSSRSQSTLSLTRGQSASDCEGAVKLRARKSRDATRSLSATSLVAIPAALNAQKGKAGERTATLTLRATVGAVFVCQYRGGKEVSSEPPGHIKKKARRYIFDHCEPAAAAGTVVMADEVRLHVDDGGLRADDGGPHVDDGGHRGGVSVVLCPVPVGKEVPLEAVVGTWPPLIVGATDYAEEVSTPLPNSLTDEREAELLEVALANSEVRNLVGARFAHIVSDEAEPPKDMPPNVDDPLRTVLTFFSHSNNFPILVRMSDSAVTSVERSEVMPPEGPAEIELAISIARADSRLRDWVVGLFPGALLADPPSADTPWIGHRVLHVTFATAEEGVAPSFSALVDLTTQTVIGVFDEDGNPIEIIE